MKKSYVQIALIFAFLLSGCGSESNSNEMSVPGSNEMNSNEMTVPKQPSEEQQENENGSGVVKFPENYTDGLIYTTVDRGNAHEKLYVSPESIEALQNDGEIPSGSVIALEIYRDEVLSDIFVMEKRTDWEDQPAEEQNGDWRFQAFNADQSVNMKRDVASCISCHASQERDDFVYTLDEMKTFELEDFQGEAGTASSSLVEEWRIHALTDYLVSMTNNEENT
ncbi:cytochrome P460 family protein [Paenibacillus arenilitoris]|uniref:Cytochrome P460 family protein n=1 Tax=Paenibacillus arenilitoris TaxID=2772299 RepID=A0A927H895_9BACL|nr:cytochrome P460 family protein [Paenibacillus arenilitoris]MBD2872491.1 cytochrome P460 family protein [Paenibacillus arenilitoris]